jgi:membrane protein implicated in regulation of membrane protease activity
MAWWSWGILGMALLCVELLAVDAQFYLVLAGVAAILVGLLGLIGIDIPVYGQWLLFAVLAIATMFTVRGKIYGKLMNNPRLGKIDTDVDQRVVVTQELPPGKSCRLEYRGSGWTAVNVGERAIAAGDSARIDSIEGLTLHVRAL